YAISITLSPEVILEKRVISFCFLAPLVGITEKSIGAIGNFLLCWLRCSEIHSGLRGVGTEGEEETGVEEGETIVDMGKCVEMLGGGIEKEANPPTLTRVGVTIGEETMWVEVICEMREEKLGDRSTREEKMEEEGGGM
ncbi:hypothetical protein KI387_022364, partial [Taxus chinensis]